jgi:uncharacterized membrane protein
MRYRVALLVYWANIFLLGMTLYLSWLCALDLGVVKSDLPANVTKAIKGRIVVAQALYAVAALLCVVSTYWSIGFIVLLQLYYAVAPKMPGRE